MAWKKVVGPGTGSGGSFQGLYYTNSVINGPTFESQGSGQAAFLQIKSETSPSILQIKTGTPPLQVQFADGINNGERQSVLAELDSTLEIDVSGKSSGTYQVWANHNNGSLSFDIQTPVETYRQFDQPSNPSSGDGWLDMENNLFKTWNGTSWVEEKKALIGRIGIGSDGQIYTTTCFPSMPEVEQLNPAYVSYDGVMLATSDQYLTENSSKWVDTQNLVEDVAASSLAMDAVSSSSNAMDAVSNSSAAMDAVSSNVQGRTGVIRSQYVQDTIWNDTMPSEKIWRDGADIGSESWRGTTLTTSLVSNGIGGYNLELSSGGGGGTGIHNIDVYKAKIDFDTVDEIQLTIHSNYKGVSIEVGGDEIENWGGGSTGTKTTSVSSSSTENLTIVVAMTPYTSQQTEFGRLEFN